MKNIFIFLFITFSLGVFSQIEDPIEWSTSVEKISDSEFVLVSTATIEEGWHLYSQNVPEDGPVPTTFTFDDSEQNFSLIEKTIEEKGHTIDDTVFQMKIKFFENKAVFRQEVKVLSDINTINGVVEFMVCDDSKCLAPTEIDLKFNIPNESENPFNSDEGLLNPVKWKTSIEKISKVEYDLVITAEIDADWHLYSQHTADGGALPIEITKSNEKDAYDLVGKAVESDTIKKFNEIFDVQETYFDNKAILKQRIKLKNQDISKVTLNLTGQVCRKVCIQIDEDFTFLLNGKNENSIITSVDNTSVNNLLYGMNTDGLSFSSDTCKDEIKSNSSEIQSGGKSLWNIFGLGFLGGLLALLTPCVFPMIPLTVSFFTKKSGQNKGAGISKALLYGFFIFAVYILLSVPFHLLDSVNPDILNEISTNIWLNIIFFIIFVFFAFSFFGYYELTLPASWTNKTTQGENSGGFIGIFFMALTLAIVSFSCTGPILGSLLAGSLTADGGAWQLTAGMAGFGVSLGLPFALFAMFPNMMNALPKSGGWLNTTKVILGFLELALAFKFLSNADLVAHWNLLKIEPFLLLWILIFAGLALYLLGKIKFPHDSPIKKLSFSRIAGGILVASFVVYLASGFMVNKETKTFTPLTLLSGLAPPVGYSFLYPNDCPNNLDCFKDLKKGIEYANKVNKPIMLDFTGYACVNCRKMEEHVWPNKKIDNYLRNDYVLISLYVDDKKELPKEEQILVNRINGGTRKLETYGNKWANYQTQFFKTNSQPYYVLLNSDGTKILNQAVGYTPDENDYAKFLECGLEVFKNNNKE
ncbi:protein-disulfide reductase DsbD family protein [Polaribacter sp. Hel1_85]|uniref:protein-disulfide reductase DsbD family protein n=1 Tax=Polaribacter sp. Hel1_85 TaxID=1250005 RepID=UPI00052BEC13|nr:protein-disulfide reductase DsbD domain-containing protein [Polaribacter sp. Hel1_85]KGL58840.1 protein-disulfide reductase [Polaribacter sp. Hel1_85]